MIEGVAQRSPGCTKKDDVQRVDVAMEMYAQNNMEDFTIYVR